MFANEKELLVEALENYRDSLKDPGDLSPDELVALAEDVTIAGCEAELEFSEDPELEALWAMFACLNGNLARVEAALAWVLSIEPYSEDEED